jgi:hypothetical protein
MYKRLRRKIRKLVNQMREAMGLPYEPHQTVTDRMLEAARSVPYAVTLERAIREEPELPGDIPDEMYAALQGDRDACAEALRMVVRLTKQNILARAAQPPIYGGEFSYDHATGTLKPLREASLEKRDETEPWEAARNLRAPQSAGGYPIRREDCIEEMCRLRGMVESLQRGDKSELAHVERLTIYAEARNAAIKGLLAHLPELWGDSVVDGMLTLNVDADAIHAALSNIIPTLRSQEIGWQYTRAESGHVLWTCRRCKRQAWSPGTQPVACACDFRCCGASDPPCTDFDGSCKNPANYPPAKPAADEYTPGCNFPRCVCPDGKECSK